MQTKNKNLIFSKILFCHKCFKMSSYSDLIEKLENRFQLSLLSGRVSSLQDDVTSLKTDILFLKNFSVTPSQIRREFDSLFEARWNDSVKVKEMVQKQETHLSRILTDHMEKIASSDGYHKLQDMANANVEERSNERLDKLERQCSDMLKEKEKSFEELKGKYVTEIDHLKSDINFLTAGLIVTSAFTIYTLLSRQ